MQDVKLILKAVNDKLKTLFNLKVYGNDTKEGYTMPCFHTELIINSFTKANKHIYKTDLTINIAYLQETPDEISQFDVIKKMRENLSEYLQVGDRVLHIDELSFSYTGDKKDVLETTLDITFYENTYVHDLSDPITDVSLNIKKED